MTRVMLLDGQYQHSLAIASELSREIGAHIIGVSPSERSHLHRSRYVDEKITAPLAVSEDYADTIVRLAHEYSPNVIVPVGYYSFRKMIDARSRLPEGVRLLAPSRESFAIAENKCSTYALAQEVAVDFPGDFTPVRDRPDRWDSLPFPIFAKARMERGGQSTALIEDKAALAALNMEELGGDVLLQEFIDADPFTYAFSGFFVKGEPVVAHQHLELRSVPRRGGSGTRLRTIDEEDVRAQGGALMRALEWTGVGQVEFKRRRDGRLVLMEINPKFWASYALASRSGAHVAAAAVRHALDVPQPVTAERPRLGYEMVFPVREALYALTHRGENLVSAAAAMLWPPAAWDVEFADFTAHLPRRNRSTRL